VLVFFVAGRAGVEYRTFLTADGMAGLISIPVLVVLGHVFAHQLPRIQERVHGIQTIIVVVLVLYILQGIVRSGLRMRQSRQDD
jgi:membrane protein DedA with SNARE-associated domain